MATFRNTGVSEFRNTDRPAADASALVPARRFSAEAILDTARADNAGVLTAWSGEIAARQSEAVVLVEVMNARINGIAGSMTEIAGGAAAARAAADACHLAAARAHKDVHAMVKNAVAVAGQAATLAEECPRSPRRSRATSARFRRRSRA